MEPSSEMPVEEQQVWVPAGPVTLEGNLTVPVGAVGIVLFAHGSGSSRHSPRNRFVAKALQNAGLATLLIDLLTADEESADMADAHLRFDIGLLAERLIATTDWLTREDRTADPRIGYFGASTAPGQRSLPPRNGPHSSAQLSLVAAVRIWPARRCARSARRRSSLWAVATTPSLT